MKTHTIKKWRKQNRITQSEFADLISVSRWTVNRIENGERFPGRETIGRIVDATNGEIGAAELIGSPPQSLSG